MDRGRADPLIVETQSGFVRGSVVNGLRAWRGIPFAAPPIGRLRLRSPEPVEPWEGVRDALRYGSAAPQHEGKVMSLPDGIDQSEDCLTLNVFATREEDESSDPDADSTDNVLFDDSHGKPVMVWIHGGAYVAGCSAPTLYDPAHVIENGDVVFVSVHYRLGALGFLDFSSFATDDEPFDTNLGLRDILAALGWVQRNIAAFGGDPDRVTIFGQSAGGGCVTTLLTSPYAAGLFSGAIAQSSPASSIYDTKRAAAVAAQFLEILGVSPDDPAALRLASPAELSAAALELMSVIAHETPGSLAFAPVVDADVVPVHPLDAYQAGTQLRVPLIIGTNHDEATLFRMIRSPLMPVTPHALHSMFAEIASERPDLEASAETRVEAAYPTGTERRASAELARDAGFRMPSIWLAAAHSRVAPTRMYRFDHATPMLKLLGLGATHGTEVAYVFGNFGVMKKDPSFDLGGLPEARLVSASIQSHWVNFAANGDVEDWPLYEENARSTLVIDHEDVIVDDPDGAVREAWGDEIIGYV